MTFITTRPELARPATTLYQHNLTGILETAVRATNAQFDNPEILKRLDVRLLEVCCIMVTLTWNIPLCVCTHAGIYFVCVYEYISPLPYHWSVLWIIQRSFNKSSYFSFPCLLSICISRCGFAAIDNTRLTNRNLCWWPWFEVLQTALTAVALTRIGAGRGRLGCVSSCL